MASGAYLGTFVRLSAMIFPFSDNIPSVRRPFVTYILIIANLLALGWLVSLPEPKQRVAVFQHGFVPARLAQLVTGKPITVDLKPNRGAVVPRQARQQVQPFQLEPVPREIFLSMLTCMFLHAGFLHLLGNMWFLWIFGDNVEDRLGHVTYLLFYLAGGLAATVCHWWIEPSSTIPVIGASGAVAAVLGAYIVTWPFAKVRTLVFLLVFITLIELPALVVLGLWFLTQVVGATSGPEAAEAGVAWWAHVGGFVAGMLLMIMLKENRPPSSVPEPGTLESVFHRPARHDEPHWY